MSDAPRVYSDEEFALILRKATELAGTEETSGTVADGLTLAQMQAAAAQVGIDPALMERAAQLVAGTAAATPIERLMGGPVQHVHEIRLPFPLTEHAAAQLLSVVRISGSQAGHRDVGHAASMGMAWHDGGDMEVLGVSARPVESGTEISVVLNRRGTLAIVTMASGVSLFLLTLFSIFGLYPEWPAGGIGGFLLGSGSIGAIARRYWVASTRAAQERTGRVLDAIRHTLNKTGSDEGV